MINKQIQIFSGNSNPELAEKIAKYIQTPLSKITITPFKDGEIYVKIDENVRGSDVFVIQSTSKSVNHNLMELAIIIDALKRSSADRITAVIPYYGYARQDRQAKPREPITAKLVANILTTAGADRILTLDLHAPQIEGFFEIPVDHLTATSLLANCILDKKIQNPVVVAPDAGSAKKSRRLAQILNSPLAIIDKRREEANKIAESTIIGDIKDKTCIMIDDMIDTGGTISSASKTLIEKGAKEIYILASHAVLSEPALERLNIPEIKEVIFTDSIKPQSEWPKKINSITIAPLLGEAIKRIHENKSLSSLFDDVLGNDYFRKLAGW